MERKAPWNRIIWLALFSIAMGFLETTVVIYLRQIYYPGGFRFPLTLMDSQIITVELLREIGTVVMLVSVAALAGRSFNQRLAYFLAAFSIWDLFYYVFLKLMLDWPESFLTWDILFLIPVPWIGPVLAPCLISVTMLLFAATLLYHDIHNPSHRLRNTDWALLIPGSLLVILSWTWDYFVLSFRNDESPEEALAVLSNFIPQSYPWWLFLSGEILLLWGIFSFWKRRRMKSEKLKVKSERLPVAPSPKTNEII